MSIKLLKKLAVAFFFLFVAIIYFHNLTRDVYAGDIGDLVTSAFVFGVAHPPGYPLFSLIGFIFSRLPISLPVVSKVGLISVIASLAGLAIFYRFSLKVTKNVFLSLLSTSILAFSYLYWLTAEIPEGLGLNNLFVIVILSSAILFYEKKQAKYLYLLSLFIGLSLTNQLFTITLFPAVIFLITWHYKFIFSNKRQLCISLLLFLAGLAVYIYVPIAASRNPVVNWDNAVNLKNFLNLVLRRDYGGITSIAAGATLTIRLIFVKYYFQTITAVFSYQILFLAVLGLIILFKKDHKLAFALIIAFLLTGPLCFFVTASPIFSSVKLGAGERYYTVSIIVLIFAVPYGLSLIRDFLNTKFSRPIFSYIILSYFLIVPFFMIQYNFPKTDLSTTHIGNNLAENILLTLPKNAVLFVSGDNPSFTVWYAHYVLGVRPDVDIINPPGIGGNIFINKEINIYHQKNPQTPMSDIMIDTINNIRLTRQVFSTGGVIPKDRDSIMIPKGLIFEEINKKDLLPEKSYLSEIKNIWKKIKIQQRAGLALSEQNFLASEIPTFYSQALVNTGNFIANYYNDPQTAQPYLVEATWIDDTNSIAFSSLALSLYKNEGDCDLSMKNIKYAISIYPIWEQYYRLEYYLAKNCRMPVKQLGDIKKEYQYRFNQDIDKLVK